MPIAIVQRAEFFIRGQLERFSSSSFYSFIIGLMALAATLSMTVPVTFILLLAVLLRPERRRGIWLWSCLGSALGGAVLVLVFHHLAWGEVYAFFPKFETSASWGRVTRWVLEYGLMALAWTAALPLPQTPALILCGVARLPVGGVFTAMLAGKMVKYGIVVWAAYRFPQRFARLRA